MNKEQGGEERDEQKNKDVSHGGNNETQGCSDLEIT